MSAKQFWKEAKDPSLRLFSPSSPSPAPSPLEGPPPPPGAGPPPIPPPPPVPPSSLLSPPSFLSAPSAWDVTACISVKRLFLQLFVTGGISVNKHVRQAVLERGQGHTANAFSPLLPSGPPAPAPFPPRSPHSPIHTCTMTAQCFTARSSRGGLRIFWLTYDCFIIVFTLVVFLASSLSVMNVGVLCACLANFPL